MKKNSSCGSLEELLCRAAAEESEQLARELDSDDSLEPAHTFSPEFEAALEAQLRRSGADSAKRSRRNRSLRAAGLGFVCLAGLSLGIFQVEAIRTPLLDFFVDTSHKEYTSINFEHEPGAGSDTFQGQLADYLPTVIPEGYTLEEASADDYFIHASYTGPQDARMLLSVTPNKGSSVSFDTEDCVLTQQDIGTRHAYISKKNGSDRIIVLMFDNDYSYTLSGTLPEAQAVAMMQSIR